MRTAPLFIQAAHILIKKKPEPLLVSWLITQQCNCACPYCTPQQQTYSQDLPFPNVLKIIDFLKTRGTHHISFTGGEPLLYEPLEQVLHYCQVKKINTSVNTNGIVLAEKAQTLRGVNNVTISLDGSEATHDRVRGSGNFRKMASGLNTLQAHAIPYRFAMTLSCANTNEYDVTFVINFAQQHKTTVTFQPATPSYLRTEGTHEMAPHRDEYYLIINKLVTLKRTGAPIKNSIAGLRALEKWPKPNITQCRGSLLFCRIDNKGLFTACGMQQGRHAEKKDIISYYTNNASAHVPTCATCPCALRLELNLALDGKLSALAGLLS